MNRVEMGARIKEARLKSNLTQEQLAEKLGIGSTYMCDIERGAKFPSFGLFINIVDVLNVSADYILRGEVESGKHYIYDDITKKLEHLTPKQRLGVRNLVDAYIKSL